MSPPAAVLRIAVEVLGYSLSYFLYFPLSTETTDCSDQDGVEGAFPLHPSPDVLGTF